MAKKKNPFAKDKDNDTKRQKAFDKQQAKRRGVPLDKYEDSAADRRLDKKGK